MHPSFRFAPALACAALITPLCLQAQAGNTVLSGSFNTDNQLYTYDFSTSTTQSYSFFTTSYGGGTNLDGTSTPAGGFVPVLTLFYGDGDVIGPSSPGGNADPITGLADDASLSDVLSPGSYILVLSEFPNVALGNLSDGFLFASDPTATGDVCGVGGGTFLESDVAPCVQRTDSYTLDISSSAVTPEPPSWILLLSSALISVAVYRRVLSKLNATSALAR